MSKRTEAKKVRRNKRRVSRDARWIPDSVLNELATSDVTNLAAELELLDERITERGWTFDDEQSDDEFAIWFYAPSGAEVGNNGLEPVTTIWMFAPEGGELVHLVLAGTAEDVQLTPDEFFDHVEAIESYRAGDALPALD